MTARFDHLVVAVGDLDAAADRWRAAGLPAVRGGRHPVGTANLLVRGPRPAYVELIAPEAGESNPWLDRVRSARGMISWAIAVDDIDAARTALVAAGFEPDPPVPGSRRTPDGGLLEWRVCDVGTGTYDATLPFLIEWTTPMAPGPDDGPIVEQVSITSPDPDRVADLLVALGFVPSRHWPRRVFGEQGGQVRTTLNPLGDRVDVGLSSWTMSWGDPEDTPAVSLTLRVPHGEPATRALDGLALTTFRDRRRFTAAALLPSVDAVFARLGGASAAPALGHRADAWVEAITGAGLGTCAPVDPVWATSTYVGVTKALRVSGPDGTQPVTVVWGTHPDVEGTVVVVGIGDPVEVVERQPEGRSAPPGGEVDRIDDAFVLALSGGVFVVRDGERVLTRTLDGRRSTGSFARGEQEAWLAEAADGRRTDGVVRGDSWL